MMRTRRAFDGASVSRGSSSGPARRPSAYGFLSQADPATTARHAHPRDRAYRRALRSAELAAWHASGGRIESPSSPLPRARDQLARQRRNEGLLFLVLAGVAAVALGFGLQDSLELTHHWTEFTRVIQQLIG